MHLSLPLGRFLASFLVVLYAAFGVLGTALVKCQEADGTVSIEWRSTGCCAPTMPVGAGDGIGTADGSEQDQECGGCSDQALADTLSAMASHGSAATTVKAPDVPAPPPALIVMATPVVFASPERRARQMRAPHPPPCLAAIRSVIILV